MKYVMIAARDRQGVIGGEGKIPWHVPADLKFFRAKTAGRVLIMGRKTYESIGRPLPNRRICVLTSHPFPALEPQLGTWVRCYASPAEIESGLADEPELWVAGGSEIYRLYLPWAQEQWITELDLLAQGDRHYPEFDRSEWIPVSQELLEPDSPHRVYCWRRTTEPSKLAG